MEGVADLLEERGLTEADVRTAVEGAERDKTFIKEGDVFIGKTRSGKATFYAVYEKEGGLVKIRSAYSHRVSLVSEGA